MDFLLMHDFATSFIGHLENIGSLGNEDCPRADAFYFIV